MFSFATQKSSCKKLELLQSTKTSEDSALEAAVKFKILSTSLSANNKFYMSFGEKPPFHFFKCYPVSEDSVLVDSSSTIVTTDYVHPPVWGLCEVVGSTLADVSVGSVYRAMLPLGTHVQFQKAHVEGKLDNLVIHRPTTHAAYNTFTPIPSGSVCHPTAASTSGLALTCFPGIITGFGLYFALQHADYYGCDTIVVTSASSKVALAFALYLKGTVGKKIVGYTSESNKKFCESTKLYTDILCYGEGLPETLGEVVMVEISGRGDTYTKNESRVKKLLCIGNSSGTSDKDSAFANFTAYAKVKMILTMMGGPKWIRSRMNPTQELFLIMDTMQVLTEEWGKEKYLATLEDYTKTFCKEAGKWIKERKCETEETIQAAFDDIVQGSVPPSECIVLNVAKAVAHRNK